MKGSADSGVTPVSFLPTNGSPPGAGSADEPFSVLLGLSADMRNVRRALSRLTGRRGPVVLIGETGTGKELAARVLHRAWKRRGPFVAVNCATLGTLAESHLFGHVKGAFTGADSDRKGAFRSADSGTLFLDEINSLPLDAQGELLRAIEFGEVSPLGDDLPRRVDVRIISATNVPLEAEVEAGRFRADLLHRIAAFTVRMPPLRERPEDIPVLTERFLLDFAREHSLPVPRLGADATDALCRHTWPGNVRELRNVLARATLHCTAEDCFVTGSHVAAVLNATGSDADVAASGHIGGYEEQMAHFERELLLRSLRFAEWNMSDAARRLGVGRQRLAYRMRKLGIEREG